jgi:outer membrane receptor protein involved in Fe transport
MRGAGQRRRGALPSRGAAAIAIAVALAASTLPRAGVADGLADEADLHFRLGSAAYAKGDYDGALEHFLASNRLVPNRNVVYNVARSFERLSRFPDAYRYYVDALEGEQDPKVVAEVNAALARLAPSVAVLRVTTTPPGATIYLNRRDLGSRGRTPRPLGIEPGTYTVIVEIDGYEPAEIPGVEAALGKEVRVDATLKRVLGSIDAAEVHVDDERSPPVCTAPCVAQVPPGRHLVYFARAGFSAQPIEVEVTANHTVRAVARLAPITGSLLVSADEKGAVVEVDGKPMGFTPVVIQSVAVGKRRVRVSLRGYAPVEREVEVKANEQTEVPDVELAPLREVTAVSRVAESLEDAPSSVSVVDGQELRAFAYPHVAEALRGVRGVYLSNDRSYYSAGIRGLGEPNDYGNRVLVLSDGQSLNDNLLNSSYIGPDGRTDLYDIDRIEVVRGPGSLLYGTGAFSGVINLVTRPRDEPSSVHGEVGTYDNAVVHGRLGFHYNWSDKTGIWMSGSATRSDGFDVPITLISPPKGQPADQVAHHVEEQAGGGTAGRFWYGPFTVQWLFNTRAEHLTTGPYGTTLNDTRTEFVDTRYMIEARFEPRLSDKVELFTRVHANRYTFHADYAYVPAPTTEDYLGTWLGLEGRIVITPRENVRVTVGGEAQLDPQATLEGCCKTAAGGQATDELYLDAHEPYTFGAVYALAEGSPARWFRVSGGARLDVYSTFGAIVVPRLALIFKPAKGNVIKLMGGRSFRAPSVYEQFYTDGGVTQVPGNDPKRHLGVGPESIYPGEIEVSQRFLEDWVALVAGHVGYIRGLIDTIPDTPGSSLIRYANNPPAILGGADVEIRREWRQGWMLAAVYTYQHGSYLSPPKGIEATPNPDLRLVNSPDHLASFKVVVPVVPDAISLAGRVAIESGRRIDLTGDETTSPVFLGDVVASGYLRRFGLRYAVGIYNVGDFKWSTPVTPSFLSRTIEQNGRTFLADLMLTYPP